MQLMINIPKCEGINHVSMFQDGIFVHGKGNNCASVLISTEETVVILPIKSFKIPCISLKEFQSKT